MSDLVTPYCVGNASPRYRAVASHFVFTASTMFLPSFVRSSMILCMSSECSDAVPIRPCRTSLVNVSRSKFLTVS